MDGRRTRNNNNNNNNNDNNNNNNNNRNNNNNNNNLFIPISWKNYLQTHFTDGLCHIMWFSMGHCIKTKNYSTENDKILIKIDQLKNVTLSKLIEI